MKHVLICLAILCGLSSFAQSTDLTLSKTAEISLITCGPGTELYAAFGHTAFRVRDPQNGMDRVYNYGTFDFDDPNFYPNFAKGHLEYFLSAYDFSRFVRSYHQEGRWIKAQVLNLEQQDVQLIYNFLEHNASPENRVYLYDYFFDNCSTKPIDVIKATIGDKLIYPSIFEEDVTTHRALIQPYLSHLSWGDFGIDLCLGAVIDRKVSQEAYLFLPENVLLYFDALKISKNSEAKPMVKRTEIILSQQEVEKAPVLISPFICFMLVTFLTLLVSIWDLKRCSRSRYFDFALFFLTGIIGVFLLLVWFATNHISAQQNYNVLWAFAPNIAISFYMLKKELPRWISKYIFINIFALVLLLILWIAKVQIFSIAVLPILAFLGIRYQFILKYLKH